MRYIFWAILLWALPVWVELRLWMRTTRPGSELFQEEQLGTLYVRLKHTQHTLGLYRAIGLQVEDGKVVALILMGPGQLRTQLLRRGDYREF